MDLGGGIATAVGSVAFFGCIALSQWISSRSEAQKRQLEQEARLKALELGQQLPDADIAQAQADRSRAAAAGTVGTLVPLGLIGAAAGASALVFHFVDDYGPRLPLIAIIWGVCGVVSLVTVVLALVALQRRGSSGLSAGHTVGPKQRYVDEKATAFMEKPSGV